MRTNCILGIIAAFACLFAWGQPTQADTAQLGNMPAGKILFLGNSICLTPPGETWQGYWGLTASEQDKDYVHVLTNRLNDATGGSMTVAPPSPVFGRWYYGNPLPNWNGNVLNIADIFERNYDTWDNARIQNQLNWNADIVVLQFGENMTGGTMEQFQTALGSMLTALKNSSNPNIFMTSHILGSNPTVDAIKRQLCAEDPAHRVFIDMSAIGQNGANMGGYGHPSDAGMAAIADTLFDAMATHAVPEPSSIALACTALVAMFGYAWKKRT